MSFYRVAFLPFSFSFRGAATCRRLDEVALDTAILCCDAAADHLMYPRGVTYDAPHAPLCGSLLFSGFQSGPICFFELSWRGDTVRARSS